MAYCGTRSAQIQVDRDLEYDGAVAHHGERRQRQEFNEPPSPINPLAVRSVQPARRRGVFKAVSRTVRKPTFRHLGLHRRRGADIGMPTQPACPNTPEFVSDAPRGRRNTKLEPPADITGRTQAGA